MNDIVMKLKEWNTSSMPRERLIAHGVSVLSNAELLALILNTGSKKENVVDLCHRLLATHALETLSTCSLTELQSIHGIGEAKACRILSLFELNKRYTLSKVREHQIKSAEDVSCRSITGAILILIKI